MIGLPLICPLIACPCGANMSVEHALSCPKGGLPTIWHKMKCEIQSLAGWRKYVTMWYTLQPITEESLDGATAIMNKEAWLDIVADGFWEDISREPIWHLCFNPLAPSNANQSLQAMPPIKYMTDGRCNPMISESEKSSMAHSLYLWCLQWKE